MFDIYLFFHKLKMEENSIQYIYIIYISIRVIVLEDSVGLPWYIEKKYLSCRHLLSNRLKNIFIFKKAIKKVMAEHNNFISFLQVSVQEQEWYSSVLVYINHLNINSVFKVRGRVVHHFAYLLDIQALYFL